MKHRFFEDMQELCNMVSARDDALNALFLDIDNDKNPQIQAIIALLQKLDLPDTQPNRFALLSRLVHLSESAVIQTLKKAGKSNEEIKKSKKILLDWVSDFHTKTHQEIVEECENRQLLTPFYRQILQGMHHIGEAFNALHDKWKFTLIEDINPALLEEFGGDVPRLLHALQAICEISESGEKSDRSYSIPQLQDGQLRAIAYADAFRDEIDAIQKAIKQLIKELKNEGDDLFGAKECYIAYFRALKAALSEESVPKLLGAWREVDRAWMRLKTPIQPAHPLEYYEDHYRKAVAPEWDLRIVHISPQPHLDIKQQMQETFAKLYAAHESPDTASMKALVQHSLHHTDLYLCLPALYYGAEMDGLFSAQVVPNDESVSKQFGKKIFAFPARVLRLAQYRPFMRLTNEIFPESFLKDAREILFFKPEIWHKLYQISTIGHEFGHIFWIDDDTEIAMDEGGNFKNIEEFKATTGGLVNFFLNDTSDVYAPLCTALLGDVIRRAVGLIAWMEQGEVLPYYCEGLIHLHILFEAQILRFDGAKLHINLAAGDYNNVKALYMRYYHELSELYIAKRRACAFLERFAKKDSKGNFMPTAPDVRAFVTHFWNRYQEIGQEIDRSDAHKQYLARLSERS